MVNWTPEQEQAIYEKDNNILVAAAAGSGKTAVLVERIIEKILDEQDPVDIDELLVATFTNAAAEEMSQRIAAALEGALDENPTSYHLKKQLSLLQRASISTIHSFCLNVVRQYTYVLDLDPAFRIADEMEIDLLKHEVIDDLFEERYGGEGEELERFFAVVDMFSSDRSDVKVEDLVLRLHTFAKQNPWPEKWLHKVTTAYDIDETKEEAEIEWLTLLKEEIEDQFTSLRALTYKGIDIANSVDGPYHYEEALQADLQLIEAVLEAVNQWSSLRDIIQSSQLKALSRKRVECDEAKKDAIKGIRQQLRDRLQALKADWFSRSLESHLKDMQRLKPVVQELTKIVLQFEERFLAEKRKRGIVDFNDLEHFALQILIDDTSTEAAIVPTEIARYYEKQFKEILVDEYQDINLVQETIIQAISKKSGSGNVFMVGDVKQSIYRFRHAEPSLFIDKYENYQKDEREGKRIDLAKNFRSRETVLTGANFIFKQIFDKKLGDIEYDQAAELVYGNKSYEDYPLQESHAELILIEESEAVEKAEDEFAEQLTKVQQEARLYAQKIKKWLGHDGAEPLQIIDKETKRQRHVKYKDIVILLRSMTSAPTIVDEFKKQGIPVHSELRTGYFQAIEIQVMINFLKIIDNPYQDIPLASVLRSPIVGLNEEELAQIRLAKNRGSFYEALRSYSKQQDSLSEILRRFLQALEKYRKLAREGSLSELIWIIFQETGYYDFVGGIPGGRQRQANLRALYDRARSYEETSFRGLFRFLRFIERMEEQSKDLGEARALSEQEDVVRIMTIHKSKGLEFPIVLLGEVNKQFNMRDLMGDYLLNKEHGFATKFIDPVKRISYATLYYIAVAEEEKRQLLSEEMRVLYVALTRAKEKLVMVGHVKELDKQLDKWQEVEDYEEIVLPNQLRKNAKSYLDWIGPALVRHKQNDILRENKVMPSCVPEQIINDPSQWSIEVVASSDLRDEEVLEDVGEEDLLKTIKNWKALPLQEAAIDESIAKKLSFTYPFEAAAHSRAKQSVTEIKRRFDEVDDYSSRAIAPSFQKIAKERPFFLQKEKQLTRAEIGTAMHTVMQHIPLKESWTKSSLKPFITQLVQEEKLTETEADHIDLKAIEHFFQTDLAKLLKVNKVEREIPFSYTVEAKQVYTDWTGDDTERVLIQGVIDCIIFTEDGIVLLDYKTDQIHDEEIDEEVILALKKRYEVQMKLYKEALENILQAKVTATYLYFFSRQLTIAM